MRPHSRRELMIALAGFDAVGSQPLRSAFAQPAARTLVRVRSLNHFGIVVSDTKRSIDFYQGLFGLPVQARTGPNTILQIGSGPQFLSIGSLGTGTSPGISHYCLGVPEFNVDRVITTLAVHGVTKADAVAPMKVTVTITDGRYDVLFGDPDGIECQLQDVRYCGGSSALGTQCPAPEPAATRGLIALKDLNHLTMFSANPQRLNTFYRDLFGFSIRSYQGPDAPTLAVGPATQFLMFARGGLTSSAARAGINHACWSDGFSVDAIPKALDTYRLRPREGNGPPAPLQYYVTMRMQDRSGAPTGTPELYFTDPDGLLMQLQDATYRGGSGVLGNQCANR